MREYRKNHDYYCLICIYIDVLHEIRHAEFLEAPHVYRGFSLMHVFEEFARTGQHRTAVLDGKNKVIGIITQR